uniref:Uncharacterized protein n=1 Tax=Chrysemys picta bellii TaxID=8478 RepID=A0A8C3F9U1_CHRPI
MRSQRGRGSVAMSCSLLLLLLLLRPRGAGGCLHCDRPFLRGLGVLLGEAVPSEVPNRDALIQRQVQAFERLYSTHLPEKHHRVLGVRPLPWGHLGWDSRGLRGVCGTGGNQGSAGQWGGGVGGCGGGLGLTPFLSPEEDPRDAERKEITLYLFLVCQSVLLASADGGLPWVPHVPYL